MGVITSNPLLYDSIPRIIRNDNPPSMKTLLFSSIDLVLAIVSIFIIMRLLTPNAMSMNGVAFWLLIGLFLIIPLITTVIFSIVRNSSGSKDNWESTIASPLIALLVSLLPVAFLFLYFAFHLTGVLGFDIGFIYILLWIAIFIPLSMGIVTVSKSIAPLLVLLLGPGVIPHLAGKSFYEFCCA